MEEYYPIWLSIILGIPLGCGISFAVCSLKGKAKQAFLLGSGGSITGVLIVQATTMTEVEVSLSFLSLSLTALVTASLLIYFYVSDLKKKCPTLPFNISYLISSDSRLTEIYEQYIESETQGIARKDELDIKSKELKEKEDALNLKSKELEKQRKAQEEMEENIKERVKNGYTLSLPDSKNIPLSESMVRSLPRYFEHILRFLDEVGLQFEQLNARFPSTDDFPKEILIKSSLEVIARSIRSHLIQDSSARVTFRILDGNHFKAFAVDSRGGAAKSVSDIPNDSTNMIKASAGVKRGLVKSINPEYDYNSNGIGSKWDDYLTSTFEQYVLDEHPLISMNISIQGSSSELSNFLKFMSYIKFEILIEDLLDMVDDNYSLKSFLLSLQKEAA
ncbi:hypothetical protein LY624_03640 [Pseudoalteromonas sp. N1230-9]|uniref:hypothetical protein n=1 Tax=unclassified Pseudoalteromonas TaxID=194690 RepID=UPI0010231DB8|nr:hypothetical protein EXT42_10350 [Pseudoalteromonas sp. CO302Y]RZG09193.1 hypothetical protein EXT40_10365 [Pseudoalteromonas sp. CO133X]WOC26996.1 hypothetical protein LY624_03640 [Pseudoalteromonas sp. N1230-9]